VCYITGYLLRKLELTGLCDSCRSKLAITHDLDVVDKHMLIHFKTNEDVKKEHSLRKPSIAVTELMVAVEKDYSGLIDSYLHQSNIHQKVVHAIVAKIKLKAEFWYCNTCHYLERMISLYCRVRIFHTVRLINDGIKKVSNRKNRKHLKLSHS
jgi:hypothetical protein